MQIRKRDGCVEEVRVRDPMQLTERTGRSGEYRLVRREVDPVTGQPGAYVYLEEPRLRLVPALRA